MLHLLTAFLLATAPNAPGTAIVATSEPLHCRVDAGAAKRRCAVTVPAGRTVRACDAAAATAKRCDATGRYVARVVESGGARCRLSKKRTDWARTVAVSMSKKSTTIRGAACDLYVEVR